MYAFSFCLYGTWNPKYYSGLTENLKLINTHFPEFRTYVYIGSDVAPSFIETLTQFNNVHIKPVANTGHILMMYRFLAIDEPDVEIMFVRDADSRIHHRDRFAIKEFIDSSFLAHAIRDHPYHTVELLGGLWALKKNAIPSMEALVSPHLTTPWKFGYDQHFLKTTVYPKIKDTLLVHTSQTYRYSDEEIHTPFPWTFSEACYCGKAEGNQSSSLLRIFRR